MIVVEEKSQIIKGGSFGKEVDLRIKASPKAFKILSDGLYSDKILAVVRELSTNAYDAHVEAGIGDKPFEVTLPNSFNPNLIVRDFGNGISPENMEEIYTVFFQSTKTGTNDAIGCLGLGCKSPLSYTDSFIVDSYHKGIKNTYSIYKNEEGIPTCLQLSTEESSEPSGLCVNVPVKSVDFNNFAVKAKTVYTHFILKPIVKGNVIDIPTKNYVINNELFGIRNQDWCGAKAIMGNICYPINDLRDDSLSDIHSKVLSLDVDIYFNIGDLDVSASREKLSYDKITIENVKKKLDKVYSLLKKSVQDAVNDCSNLWDARIRYKRILTSQNFRSLFDDVKIVYDNVELSIYNLDLNSLRTEGCFSKVDGFNQRVKPDNFESTYCYINKNKLRKSTSDCYISVNVKEKKAFIYDDINGKQIRNRIFNFLNNNKDFEDVSVFRFNDQSYVDKIKDIIGIESFIKLSELPYFKSESHSSRYSKVQRSFNKKYVLSTFVYTPDKFDGSAMSSYWTSEDIDPQDSILYVKIDRFKINGDNPKDHMKNYVNIFKTIDLDFSTIKIYGIKENQEVSSNWISLQDYTKSKVVEYIKSNPTIIDSFINFHFLGLSSNIKSSIRLTYKRVKEKTFNELGEFLSHNDSDLYPIFNETFFSEDLVKTRKEHIYNLIETFKKKFPLIEMIDSRELGYYADENKIQKIVDYVELIEKSSCNV